MTAYEYLFVFLTWLEGDPRRFVWLGGRRCFDAADLIIALGVCDD